MKILSEIVARSTHYH